MAKFKITTEDGTFMVEADSAETAAAALDQHSRQNYMGKTDANGVPEGMIFDPATNRMVDAKAIADQAIPGGSWAASMVKGVPFIGEYADEFAGWLGGSSDAEQNPNSTPTVTTQVMRESAKHFEESNPKTATGLQVGASLSALPAAVTYAPAIIPQGARLGTKALIGAGLGATTGAIEGAVSGYGDGEGNYRPQSAKDRAANSALVGGTVGALVPFASQAVSSGTKYLMDNATVKSAARKLGYDPKAAQIVTDTMKADDTLGPEGMKRLARGGDDAMLVDAGPTSAGLLDAAMQKAGPQSRIARAAIDKRVSTAKAHLTGTLDLVLGKPLGMNTAGRAIAQKSAAARQAAYNKAYAQPIDYVKSAGRKIESVFARTPPSILKAAIDEANDEMISLGLRNQQIMAEVADNGTVRFRQMPNVRQVDELKKALNKIGAQVDDLGRPTPAAVRARRLSKDLRDAAVEAVPEYADAVKLGGDKIAEDQALRLGSKLLRPSTTREEVAEAIDGLSHAERKQIATGLRNDIDEMMVNVQRAISNPNLDAREAVKAFREMSSEAARTKMAMVLGESKAKAIFNSLDRTQAALELQANVATNSKTFARQQIDEGINRLQEGPYNSALEGKPLDVGRQLWRKVTGATPEARQQIEQKLLSDIAHILTGRRGPEAVETARKLMQAYDAGQLNQEVSTKIGNYLSGALAVPAYQSSSQTVSGLGRR